MNYDTRAIEREIADAKGALAGQLAEAEEKVREAVDWKTHFRSSPLPFLAGAAALGFLASTLAGPSRTAAAGVLSTAGNAVRNAAGSHLPSRAEHAFERLADVLIAVGTAKVARYVDVWLPGFHEEFSRRG